MYGKFFIVNQYAYTPDQGAGTRHFGMAKFLRRRLGLDVEIISSSFFHKVRKRRSGTERRLVTTEVIDTIRFRWVYVPSYVTNGAKRFLGFWVFAIISFFILLRNSDNRSCILASSPQPIACIFAYFASRLTGSMFIYEVRDLWPVTLRDLGGISESHIVYKLFLWIERFLSSKSELCISVLPHINRYSFENGLRKFRWIPNGVSQEYLDRVRELLTEDRVLFDDIKVREGWRSIVYAGAHGKAQNLRSVLSVAKELSLEGIKFRFDFYGDGTDKKDLVAFCKDNDINNVNFHDPVPKWEIYKVMSMADLLLLPLCDAKVFEYGVSPNKLYDYMAVSKPIVFWGPKSACTLEHCKNAFVVAPIERDLVDIIKMIYRLDSQLFLRKIGMNAKNLLVRRFILDNNLEILVGEIEKIYLEKDRG